MRAGRVQRGGFGLIQKATASPASRNMKLLNRRVDRDGCGLGARMRSDVVAIYRAQCQNLGDRRRMYDEYR